MSRSEFRYNKKRKHYAYLFKDIGNRRKNIIISSKPFRKWKGKNKRNIKLFKHPNPNSDLVVYLIPLVYIDGIEMFDTRILNWNWNKNDKRIVKRIKKKANKKTGIELTSTKTGISTG